eukprot:3940303-Rhodomonas_salina.1
MSGTGICHPGTRCPLLTCDILPRARYTLCGTEVGYAATRRGVRVALRHIRRYYRRCVPYG